MENDNFTFAQILKMFERNWDVMVVFGLPVCAFGGPEFLWSECSGKVLLQGYIYMIIEKKIFLFARTWVCDLVGQPFVANIFAMCKFWNSHPRPRKSSFSSEPQNTMFFWRENNFNREIWWRNYYDWSILKILTTWDVDHESLRPQSRFFIPNLFVYVDKHGARFCLDSRWCSS